MPELTVKKTRPIWYNISLYNLPVPGLVSIFHRISGVFLSLALVALLYLLDGSMRSEADFERIRIELSHPLVKLTLLGLGWAFLHHFCAGIRFLFLDINMGIKLPAARATSFAVFAISALLAAVLGVQLW